MVVCILIGAAFFDGVVTYYISFIAYSNKSIFIDKFICFFVNTDRYLLPLPPYLACVLPKKKRKKNREKVVVKYTYTFF